MFITPNGLKKLYQQHFLNFGIQVIEEIAFLRAPHDAPRSRLYAAILFGGVRRPGCQPGGVTAVCYGDPGRVSSTSK
jgi:hypothetical protein